MADSQLILDLLFLHIRGGCPLALTYVKRMLPLFCAVVKNVPGPVFCHAATKLTT